eukprot:182102-Chlamydomonas_euryale.AAC.1
MRCGTALAGALACSSVAFLPEGSAARTAVLGNLDVLVAAGVGPHTNLCTFAKQGSGFSAAQKAGERGGWGWRGLHSVLFNFLAGG